MSVAQSPKAFILLALIAIVTETVDLFPLNRPRYVVFSRETLPTRNEQPVTDKEARPPRNLGNNDITKLLDDLDNQTEAIKSGQEIGEELLGEKNDTRFKEKLERKNNSLFVRGHNQNSTEDITEEVTDSASQAVNLAESPVLVDNNGVPEKATAIESGATYLAGKPLLILNKDSKDPDVNQWFLYYPLSTESDQQIP